MFTEIVTLSKLAQSFLKTNLWNSGCKPQSKHKRNFGVNDLSRIAKKTNN